MPLPTSLAPKPQSNSPALKQAPASASLLSTPRRIDASELTDEDFLLLSSMLGTVKRKGSPRAPPVAALSVSDARQAGR